MASGKEKLFNSDKEKNNYHADMEFEMRYWKDDEYFDSSPVEPVEHKALNTWPPPRPKNHTKAGWDLFIKEYERVILKKGSK